MLYRRQATGTKPAANIPSTARTETLKSKTQGDVIKVFTIIGEIEGHELSNSNTKSTKYDHLLPQLAEIEDRANAVFNLLLRKDKTIPNFAPDLYTQTIKYVKESEDAVELR